MFDWTMSTFDEFECANCGESFTAYAGANATDGPYCSPRCESEGEGLR